MTLQKGVSPTYRPRPGRRSRAGGTAINWTSAKKAAEGVKLDKFDVPADVITDNNTYITHRLDEQEALNAALASQGWDDCSYHTAELIVGDTAAPYYSVYIEGADGASHTVNISTVDGGALSVF